MEKNTILKTSLLDIIFEGRNKEYGAYELRSQYNSRLAKAMAITLGLGLVTFLSSFLTGFKTKEAIYVPEAPIVTIVEVDKLEPPPVIPPPQQVQQQVATTTYVTPRIVPNEEVKPEEEIPEISELENTKISNVTKEGDAFVDIVAPPVTTGGVVEGPKKDDENIAYLKVEIEAEFPGGNAAWAKYVTREMERNVDELLNDGRSGSVEVMFIVDKEGSVSDVKTLPCGESGVKNCLGAGTKLAEIAINAIRKGPRWKPAIQSGRQVKAYRRQVVTFQLSEE